uniref:Uncharacterized protein n=1 Tax=Parascaris equorum TaxID=6256 RepID=A0A914S0E8_PAREQ
MGSILFPVNFVLIETIDLTLQSGSRAGILGISGRSLLLEGFCRDIYTCQAMVPEIPYEVFLRVDAREASSKITALYLVKCDNFFILPTEE